MVRSEIVLVSKRLVAKFEIIVARSWDIGSQPSARPETATLQTPTKGTTVLYQRKKIQFEIRPPKH